MLLNEQCAKTTNIQLNRNMILCLARYEREAMDEIRLTIDEHLFNLVLSTYAEKREIHFYSLV